jgi:hypothetical protein
MYGSNDTIPVIAIRIDRAGLANLSFIKSEAVMYPFSFDKAKSRGIVTSATPNATAAYVRK